MKRRNFIRRTALTMASLAGALVGISFLRQLSFSNIQKGNRVKIGKLSDFPVDTFTFVDKIKVFIYRDHEAVKAVSAVCTHLGCTIKHNIDGFECPCHGSCYSAEGRVLSGPAPASLSWYKVEKAPDGMLVVDLETITSPGEKFYIT